MIDKTTKVLLLAIAIGVWVNIGYQARRMNDDYIASIDRSIVSTQLEEVMSRLDGVEMNTEEASESVRDIASGICINQKLC